MVKMNGLGGPMVVLWPKNIIWINKIHRISYLGCSLFFVSIIIFVQLYNSIWCNFIAVCSWAQNQFTYLCWQKSTCGYTSGSASTNRLLCHHRCLLFNLNVNFTRKNSIFKNAIVVKIWHGYGTVGSRFQCKKWSMEICHVIAHVW